MSASTKPGGGTQAAGGVVLAHACLDPAEASHAQR
jgi:hypothetical protein